MIGYGDIVQVHKMRLFNFFRHEYTDLQQMLEENINKLEKQFCKMDM